MESLHKTNLSEIKKSLLDTIQDLEIEKKTERLKELQEKSLEKDFWSDNLKAQSILSEIDSITKEIETSGNLLKECQELEEIFKLASEEEKEDLQEDLEKLGKNVEEFTKYKFLSGKFDNSNAILSIHAGQGGTEAQDWAEMLLRMYTRYCERQNWQVEILHKVTGTEAGISSATLEIRGMYAYGYLKKETGTHRLVRISPFNAQGLRQTSFAGVEVIPIIEQTKEEDLEIPEKDIEFRAVKSGGPGGQHVNKTSSAVLIKHIPTGITVHCSEGRDQFKNREKAMSILKSKLILLKEEEIEKKLQNLKGEHKIAGWGNQIRNYVLHPYKLVKDLRTNVESTNPEDVLDGNLNTFLEAQLRI
jgi:peptide chain release factor 2